MSWNVQGSMRSDGVPAAPGMLDSEAVAAGILKAEGAILGLFQETRLQDPQGMLHIESQWPHNRYHAFLRVDTTAALAAAVRGGSRALCRRIHGHVIPERCLRHPGVAAAPRTVDIDDRDRPTGGNHVEGHGLSLDNVQNIPNFLRGEHIQPHEARTNRGGLQPTFSVWLESPGHPTTKRFVALWEHCGFLRARHSVEEDHQPTSEGHKLDSYLLNAPVVPWAMCERSYLAPGRPPAALGSDHGPMVLGIPLAVAAKERITRLAYSHAQGRLHATRSASSKVREAAPAVLQRACDDPALQQWLSSDQEKATMGTSALQAVFDLFYTLCDEVSRVTGVRMPSSMDPQYPYGQADTKASLS